MKVEFLADHLNSRSLIAAWFVQEWGSRYPERGLDCWIETQTYINTDCLPLSLVAIKNNEVVGTVSLRAGGMSTHPEWESWLSYLYVAKEHRGAGVGNLLVECAEQVAKSIGITKLHLFTRLEDPKLYHKLGWSVISRESYRGGLVTIMAKFLD